MWTVNSQDVIHLGRSPGGDRFTHFVDELIRAQSFLDGVHISAIHTNLRTNIGDKGVDTKVDSPFLNSNNVWLQDSCIMQYKASGYSGGEKDFEKEINKSFAKECILKGFAYRYCVCDSMPPVTKAAWEEELNRLIQNINPGSPTAYVLTAEDLAAWASNFPSIILKYFRTGSSNFVFHMDSWGKSIKSLTPEYTVVPEWEGITNNIKNMINFSIEVPDVLMTIQGEAGVGKTRLVYESISSLPEANSLVVYTNDENFALQATTMMINDPQATSIIVADECSLQARQRLRNILRGHSKRIRVIAIDNTGERPTDPTYEYWLEKMAPDLLMSVLQKNYEYVPMERLQVYAQLSGGFVRLAADLCMYDTRIADEGHVGSGLPTIREYYMSRLDPQDRKFLEAISLLSKVGYKQDVRNEMELLCNLLGLDEKAVLETAKKLHDLPGFIAIAGRYMYVTPELIAQVAFDEAYRRWLVEEPEEFLSKIPESLLQGFLVRVAWSGREEVRHRIGGYFRRRTASLTPSELAEVKTVDQLEELVEADPATFLPMLRNLVEQASSAELLNVTGDGQGRWGPRRSLVWLSERLAAFPEYFLDAEAILRQLALTENEPNISNNATRTWMNLFNISLSGTALPFKYRFNFLKGYIFSDDIATSDLAIKALSRLFDGNNIRMVGKPVVAGRIVPEEWNPKSIKERKECLEEAFELLLEMRSKQTDTRYIRSALNIALQHARTLLNNGMVEKLKLLFCSDWEVYVSRNEVIKAVEEFLHFDCEQTTEQQHNSCIEAQDWLEELQPVDLIGRLKTLVGVTHWHYSILGREEIWKDELINLSKELVLNPSIIKLNINWLFSSEAKSAFNLGLELGLLDHDLSLLDLLFEASIHFRETTLTRGYLTSLFKLKGDSINFINTIFDNMQQEYPEIAHELYVVGGDKTRAFERSISLFDEGKILSKHLSVFVYGIGDRELTSGEAVDILNRLLPLAHQGDNLSIDLTFTFIFKFLKSAKQSDMQLTESSKIGKIVWKVLDTVEPSNSRNVSEWEVILTSLLSVNPERVVTILCKYVGSENYTLDEHACSILSKIAKEYSSIVMDTLGKALLDDNKSVRFFIRKYDDLIQAISSEIIITWIEKNGVEAARKLARHLPLPYLGENSKPIVPILTEYILSNFEDDDRVYREFIGGAHSSQMYSGDIAAQYESEAKVAKNFLNNKLKRVREWAIYEIESSEHHAKEYRTMNEELDLK